MSNKANNNQEIERVEAAVMGEDTQSSEVVYSTELADENGGPTEAELNDFQEKLKEAVETQEANAKEAKETVEALRVRVNLNRVAGGLVGTLASALVTRNYSAVASGVCATIAVSASMDNEPSEEGALYNTGVGFAAGFTTGLLGGTLTNFLTGSDESEEA